MGEAPDFSVGERVDLMPDLIVGQQRYEALFPGKVTFRWVDHIDVQAGEQIFRVPRRALLSPRREGEPYYFRPESADELIEIEHYRPENEIDESDGEVEGGVPA